MGHSVIYIEQYSVLGLSSRYNLFACESGVIFSSFFDVMHSQPSQNLLKSLEKLGSLCRCPNHSCTIC